MPDQKTMWTRCLGGFSVMWVTKLLISPVKKGFFGQKRPNLAQNWHFWSIWARPCRLIQCPVGGSVGGCGARAVSRKTPIYFILMTFLVVLRWLIVTFDKINNHRAYSISPKKIHLFQILSVTLTFLVSQLFLALKCDSPSVSAFQLQHFAW